MELSEIYTRLKRLNIPTAYLRFSKPQNLPFQVYYEAGGEVMGADTYNLFRRVNVNIELYTEKKDITLERAIETQFRDVPLEKQSDIYLEKEDMHMVLYSFETIQKIQDDV